MIILKIFILLLLLFIFFQDMALREVYWISFPLLAGTLLLLNVVSGQQMTAAVLTTMYNFIFLSLQFFLVTSYFSIKERQWVHITKKLIGWGDLLFLISIAFYLSLVNFIVFYVLSLILVLLVWGLIQWISARKREQIPLAGFQALAFVLLLLADWTFHLIRLNSDQTFISFFS